MSANSGRLFYKHNVEEDKPECLPLGYTLGGRPVWPIFGAEEDDSDDDDGDDGDDEDDDSGTKDGDKDKGKDGDDDDLAEANARAERYRRRMKAADRRAAEAERERDALKNSKEGDGDQGAAVAEKDKQIESLSEANRSLRLQNAFLLNNSYTWHDPADVMAMALRDEELEIDEDGEVTGMDVVLKRIAKKKPWLIKPADDGKGKTDDDSEDDDEDDTEDEPESRRRSTRSGSTSAGRRKRKGEVDREALLRTFPALARR